MRSVRRAAIGIAIAQVALLGVLAASGLVGAPGLVAGAAYGLLSDVLVLRSRTRDGRVGPADLVTWGRCALVGVVVALVVDGRSDARTTAVLVSTAGVALLLDGLDGQVARRTGTLSGFGARFDMEVDASLVLALSIGAAQHVGLWVLLIGAARYLLLVATVVAPILDRPTPPRLWRKVVAVAQGLVLTLVCSHLLPAPVAESLAIAAAAALAWSFATQIHGLVTAPHDREIFHEESSRVVRA